MRRKLAALAVGLSITTGLWLWLRSLPEPGDASVARPQATTVSPDPLAGEATAPAAGAADLLPGGSAAEAGSELADSGAERDASDASEGEPAPGRYDAATRSDWGAATPSRREATTRARDTARESVRRERAMRSRSGAAPPVAEEFEPRPVDEEMERRRAEERDLLLDKLAPEPWSEIPHTVRDAWDNAPDYAVAGDRVRFELEVEPSISDADLETLLRDYREAYTDTKQLTVMVREVQDPESGVEQGPVVGISRWDDDAGTDLIGIHGLPVEP
jgi:hypothetical protein